jgi:ribosome biogenesis GTPase A
MNLQWFPGHMSKTIRILKENIKLVDVVIELVDARIPISSTNPEFKKIIGNKPKIIALNKFDLADKNILGNWKNWYYEKDQQAVFVNSLNGQGVNELKNKIQNIMEPIIENDKSKGRKFRTIRTMIVGIPNVGKSSFINRVAKKSRAKTGDKPGITKTKQWIRLNNEIEMLDTPGALWPKFENEIIGLNLAFTGAIKDEIIDIETLCLKLIERLILIDKEKLELRYKLELEEYNSALEIMELIGKKRGCLISKGEIDYNRTANIILDEFRSGKIGKFTLETPDELNNLTEDTNG